MGRLHLGLGLPADRIATPRETTFLPLYLMEAFDHATVLIDGTPQPLEAIWATAGFIALDM